MITQLWNRRFSFSAWIGLILTVSSASSAFAAPAPAPSTVPEPADVPVIFRDMGVVQNKAMSKTKRWLLAPSFSVDFSDGPFSMYGIGAGVGYAISDFWEVYLLANPKFLNKKRTLVQSIEKALAESGSTLSITGGIAQHEYGLQVLWAPLYGKDSLGISRIIRSDTFLRFVASTVQYDIGSGLKFGVGVGKTYFLGKNAGLRVVVEENMLQTILQGVKEFGLTTFVESGLVFYF
jgi:outer membrane beta-barrel protein